LNGVFADRSEAGRSLAALLRSEVNPVVLGIARGGVIVADAVARVLEAPIDVLVIRKVGHPLQPELALGAVCATGERVVTSYAGELFSGALSQLFEEQAEKARGLEASLRGGVPRIDIRGRTIILVDDGIATSATMECAVEHARNAGAERIVCAAPVAPVESVAHIETLCDAVVVAVLSRDRDFAVGRYYLDFREIDDRQMLEALTRAR
jgi:putative phosphoribosyl transferase